MQVRARYTIASCWYRPPVHVQISQVLEPSEIGIERNLCEPVRAPFMHCTRRCRLHLNALLSIRAYPCFQLRGDAKLCESTAFGFGVFVLSRFSYPGWFRYTLAWYQTAHPERLSISTEDDSQPTIVGNVSVQLKTSTECALRRSRTGVLHCTLHYRLTVFLWFSGLHSRVSRRSPIS